MKYLLYIVRCLGVKRSFFEGIHFGIWNYAIFLEYLIFVMLTRSCLKHSNSKISIHLCLIKHENWIWKSDLVCLNDNNHNYLSRIFHERENMGFLWLLWLNKLSAIWCAFVQYFCQQSNKNSSTHSQ